ncbi:uroporphyrinogen-III synthase [Sinomonas albida]|uniref:uroporphyrinogen-III synthase n=1 Tax=Sinomonas albida TaxID=369942 RepID=UPI001F2DE6C6|nr:uroporphyrinogen-III synthase [Sinomonas albida]
MTREAGNSAGELRGPLAGRRVLLTRSPDRAGAMAAALAAAGAEPLLLPLIDFARATDQAALAGALDRLAAGEYAWLVVSSITTVRALKQFAAERGVSLGAVIPPGVRIATIGPSSRAVLEAEGLRVDLAPAGRQSAEGLVELWAAADDGGAAGADGAGMVRVLIPQSDLAGPTLEGGLDALGWDVDAVTAYRTVDYPAEPGERLTAELAVGQESGSAAQPGPGTQPGLGTDSSAAVVLLPGEANGELAAGRIDAVVAASPSAARRIHATLGALESTRLVAIGQPTAAELRSLGLAVGATAATPTPAGIVDAVAQALSVPGPWKDPTP